MKTKNPIDEKVTKINFKKLEALLKERKPTISADDGENDFNNLHKNIIECIKDSQYTVPKQERPKNPWITKKPFN